MLNGLRDRDGDIDKIWAISTVSRDGAWLWKRNGQLTRLILEQPRPPSIGIPGIYTLGIKAFFWWVPTLVRSARPDWDPFVKITLLSLVVCLSVCLSNFVVPTSTNNTISLPT
jgi:hypothetical protein